MHKKGEMQMRVFRTILGMLLLTIGLPALLVGAAFWTTMQHRDAGGAFSAKLQDVATPGYAVVIDDLDALLDKDAPFVRTGDTRLRLTARTSSGPAFIGIAPAGEAARYLSGVSHASVKAIDIGTGTLPVRSSRVIGSRVPGNVPTQQGFWRMRGTGEIDWNPSQLRDRDYSLIIMNADARPGIRLQTTAEVRPAWLNTAAWGLLLLGSLFVIAGMMVLAWPSRRREVVFVVEPSQVPELAKRMGAPLAIGSGPAGHTGAHRPRTLADANAAGTTWPKLNPPALPQLTWPPVQSGPGTAADGTASERTVIPLGGAPAPSAPTPSAPTPSVPTPSVPTPSVPTPSVPTPSVPTPSVPTPPAPTPSAGFVTTGASSEAASGSTLTAEPSSAGAPTTADGTASAAPVAAPAGGVDAATAAGAAGPVIGGRSLGDRASRRRAADQAVGERQVFEASAVEAWVAETAAARARDIDARTAAILAAEGGEEHDDLDIGTPPRSVAKPVTSAVPADSAAPAPAVPATAPAIPATAPAVTTVGTAPATSVASPASAGGSPAAGARSAPSGAASGSMPNKPFEPTLTKAAVAKAALSKPTPPPLSDEDGDDETGDVAGVPSSRVLAGERRRSRRLTEDLAAAAAAALAGSSGASGALDGGKVPAESGKVPAESGKVPAESGKEVAKEVAKADSGAHGDAKAAASVPVARTSSDVKSAELQTAPASGGRRRKATDADTTTKGRSTRRSVQPGSSGSS